MSSHLFTVALPFSNYKKWVFRSGKLMYFVWGFRFLVFSAFTAKRCAWHNTKQKHTNTKHTSLLLIFISCACAAATYTSASVSRACRRRTERCWAMSAQQKIAESKSSARFTVVRMPICRKIMHTVLINIFLNIGRLYKLNIMLDRWLIMNSYVIY